MEIYTIGFTQKTAQQFFQALKQAGIKQLLDVRLNNTSQLARFTKNDDLPYFLKELCGAQYRHEPILAPTQDMLDTYKKKGGSWQMYEKLFLELMSLRKIEEHISPKLFEIPTVLLCSEPTSEHCHRRLVLDYLQQKWGKLTIVNL